MQGLFKKSIYGSAENQFRVQESGTIVNTTQLANRANFVALTATKSGMIHVKKVEKSTKENMALWPDL